MDLLRAEDLDPIDYKYIVEKGESGFDPKRNNWVIAQTIKKSQEANVRAHREYRDKLDERIDAGMAWVKHVAVSGKATPMEKYFSRNYLAYLRGDDIRNTLVAKLSQNVWRNSKSIRRSRPDSR